MLTQANCGICGKSLFEDTFLKVVTQENIVLDEPVYWANPQFHPSLTQKMIFCSALHSFEWYQKLYHSK